MEENSFSLNTIHNLWMRSCLRKAAQPPMLLKLWPNLPKPDWYSRNKSQTIRTHSDHNYPLDPSNPKHHLDCKNIQRVKSTSSNQSNSKRLNTMSYWSMMNRTSKQLPRWNKKTRRMNQSRRDNSRWKGRRNSASTSSVSITVTTGRCWNIGNASSSGIR